MKDVGAIISLSKNARKSASFSPRSCFPSCCLLVLLPRRHHAARPRPQHGRRSLSFPPVVPLSVGDRRADSGALVASWPIRRRPAELCPRPIVGGQRRTPSSGQERRQAHQNHSATDLHRPAAPIRPRGLPRDAVSTHGPDYRGLLLRMVGGCHDRGNRLPGVKLKIPDDHTHCPS